MKKTIAFLLLLFAFNLSASNNSFAASGVTINGDTPWLLTDADYADVGVKMAFRDIQRDWYKVLGYPPVVFHNEIPSNWDGPVVIFGDKDNLTHLVDAKVPEGKEQYRIAVGKTSTNPIITVAGSDSRGTIFAMYTFTEEVLGIDPMYIFTDSRPEKKSEVTLAANYEIVSKTPTFEYRGWFINDEELHDGMHRDPLGGNVISMEWMDKILESLLRTKGNMIIPESAPYSDATVYDLCKRRNVAVSHHHVTPLGLNMMDWPKNVPFSYITHKDILEDAWEKAVKAQAGQEIVWIVGFRGESDGAFWNSDPAAPADDEGRAAVIESAIKKQIEIIRKYDKEGTIVAALWNEVGAFYNSGLLTIPDGVCKMFSDDGRGYMRDDGGIHLEKGDGLYYHVMMMMNTQNRTTEGVPPYRFYNELKRYVDKEATKYAIINVSGIRPAAMSVQAINDFLWDAETPLSKDSKVATREYLLDWYAKQFSEELAPKLTDLRMNYYGIPYMREKMPISDGRWSGARGEHLLQYLVQNWFGVGKSNDFIGAIVRDEDITKVDGYATQLRDSKEPLVETEEYFPQLWKAVNDLEAEIPACRKDYYQAHFIFQVAIHMNSAKVLSIINNAIADYIANKDKAAFVKALEEALVYSEIIIEEAHKAEYGIWDTMFMHARLMDFYETRLLIKRTIAQLTGQPYTSEARGYNQASFWRSAQEYMDFAEGTFPNFHKHTGPGLNVIEDGTYPKIYGRPAPAPGKGPAPKK